MYKEPLPPVTPPEPGKGFLAEPDRATVEEAKVINERLEHGTVYQPDGSKVMEKDGEFKDHVHFTPEEEAKLKDNIFTHNHPCGNSFSKGDVGYAAAKDMQEIRIVCPSADGGVALFRLQRPPEGWPDYRELMQDYHDASRAVYNRQQPEIDAGKLSKKQARQTFADETMKELQKRRPEDIV